MFLTEKAIDRYRQFFAGLPLTDPNVARRIDDALKWSMSVLKRRDRVEWFLRWTRLGLDADFLNGNPDPAIRSKFYSRISAFARRAGLSEDEAMRASDSFKFPAVRDLREKLEHYFSLEIHGIEVLPFGFEQPGDIYAKMDEIEEEWSEQQNQWIDMSTHHHDNAELIMEFPDGFAWWDLNKTHCTIEGGAMGHCGNSAARNGTVLSLRHKEMRGGKEMWRPVATFILHKNGSLGEMKGRGNEKPAPQYHPYIVALLRDDRIKNLRGGGYAADQNFMLSDLDHKERDKLLADKPRLAGFAAIWKMHNGDLENPELIEEIEETLSAISSRLDFVSYDRTTHKSYIPTVTVGNKEYVNLNTYGEMDDLVRQFGDYVPCFEDVYNLYENIRSVSLGNMDSETWVDILEQVHPNTLAHIQKLTKQPDIKRMATALGRINSYEIQDFLNGLSQKNITLDGIGERLREYVDNGVRMLFACPEVELVEGDDGKWFLGLPKNNIGDAVASLSDVSNTNAESYQDYDYEWSEVIENGWDHLSDSNIDYCTERLRENGIIVRKDGNNNSHHWSSKKDYVDSIYGTSGWANMEGTDILADILDKHVAGKSAGGGVGRIDHEDQLELKFPDRKEKDVTEAVIKLGAAGRMTPEQRAYLEDLDTQTKVNFMNDRERIYGGCLFTVFRNGTDGIWLSDIRTSDPKKGFCSDALKLLKALCDKHNVPLRGSPVAYHKGKDLLTQRNLVQWYKNNGFKMNAAQEIEYIPVAIREDFNWLRNLAGIN